MSFAWAGLLAVGALVTAYPPSALAQPVKVQPGPEDELRAVYATPVEIAEGARIAQNS